MYKHYLPTNRPAFGDLGTTAEHWTEQWNRLPLPIDTHRLRRTPEWQEICGKVSQGHTILEAGCGLGKWVLLFADYGYKAIGLDISEPTIARLKQGLSKYDWRTGDVMSLPFADDELDAVVSWGVIEHFEEGPSQVLREFRRVIRPGGWLFVTVPYLNWRRRWLLAGRSDNLNDFQPGQSVTFYQHVLTGKELKAWVSQGGFDVAKVVVTSRQDGAARLLEGISTKGSLFHRVGTKLVATIAPPQLTGQMVLAVARKGS